MRIVIVGTGTNIGKTHLGVALVTALARSGREVCGLKPVESGVPAGELGPDARALAAAGVFHVKQPQPYALPEPVSPHLAARHAGVTIELPPILDWLSTHAAQHLIIETAGGLLSPLAPSLTNLDLATAIAPTHWLLVAVDRLGVLHEVAACMHILRTCCSPPVIPLVVLQSPAEPDASTGTNASELVLLGIARQVLTMPRSAPDSPASERAAESILQALVSGPGL